MKVVILTRNSPISHFVINRLDDEHDYFIVVEKKQSLSILSKKLKRFIRNKGLIQGLFSWLGLLSGSLFIIQEGKKVTSYLKKRLKDSFYRYPVVKVNSVNDSKVVEIINQFTPDAIIDIGTSVIKKEIISSLRKIQPYLINWHTGITPEYRGCQPEFWALNNNDLDKIGSTIHYLDEGIDTGKIILQKKINMNSIKKKIRYNYMFLRYQNVLLGVGLLNEFIKRLEQNNLKEFVKVVQSNHSFSTPSKKDYQEYYKRLKKLNE